jgi:hypothetical protein
VTGVQTCALPICDSIQSSLEAFFSGVQNRDPLLRKTNKKRLKEVKLTRSSGGGEPRQGAQGNVKKHQRASGGDDEPAGKAKKHRRASGGDDEPAGNVKKHRRASGGDEPAGNVKKRRRNSAFDAFRHDYDFPPGKYARGEKQTILSEKWAEKSDADKKGYWAKRAVELFGLTDTVPLTTGLSESQRFESESEDIFVVPSHSAPLPTASSSKKKNQQQVVRPPESESESETEVPGPPPVVAWRRLSKKRAPETESEPDSDMEVQASPPPPPVVAAATKPSRNRTGEAEPESDVEVPEPPPPVAAATKPSKNRTREAEPEPVQDVGTPSPAKKRYIIQQKTRISLIHHIAPLFFSFFFFLQHHTSYPQQTLAGPGRWWQYEHYQNTTKGELIARPQNYPHRTTH